MNKDRIDKLKADWYGILKKNLDAIIAEIHETEELLVLLKKGTHTRLTPEEKRKVNEQLLDILKTIPALAIFALPGGAFLLPLTLKILPFNLLPSNFQNKKEEP